MSTNESKRVREAYLWMRAVDDPSSLGPIIMHEKPDIAVLKVLLEMNRDHVAIRDNVEKLEKYLAYAREMRGDIKAEYKQKDIGMFAGDDYRGARQFGRSYPSATATFMPSQVLHTMWKDSHVEVDLVASYPTILASCFRDIDIPTINGYVDNPDAIVNEFSRSYGVGRKELKKVIITVICSYPKIPSDLGIGFKDQDKLVDIVTSQFYLGLQRDLAAIGDYLEKHYAGFMRTIKRKCDSYMDEKKRDRVIGSALSYLCGDVENVIMRCIIGYLSENDDTNTLMNNSVWKFDGIVVPRDCVDVEMADSIRMRVLEKTGVNVKIAIRDLRNAIALSVNPEEMAAMGAYESWKANFEKTYCYMIRPDGYCRIWPDGSLQELSKNGFDLMTQAEDKEMMKMWRVDPYKKTYNGREFAPPPLFIGQGYYNLWHGMQAEKLPVNLEPVDIEPYLRHVRLLTGCEGMHETVPAQYLHKLIAYKFQNPGALWRVMVFIRSAQGVGKDIWLDFLFSMIGNNYTARLQKVGDVAGQYNSNLEARLMIGFSEMDARDTMENMESLKDIITSTRVTIKKKYVSSYDVHNVACFIGFSNNYNAIKINSDDRRIFSVTAQGYFANKPEYHVPLLEKFNDPAFKRAVYDYYMELDVTGFDPSGDRPSTDTMKDMIMDSLPVGDVFLKSHFHLWLEQVAYDDNVKVIDGKLRIPVATVYDHFGVMVQEMKFKDADSKRRMSLLAKRSLLEASSRIEAFSEHVGNAGPIKWFKSNSKYYIMFDTRSVKRYIMEKLGGVEDAAGRSIDLDRLIGGDDSMESDVTTRSATTPTPAIQINIPNFSAAHEYENARGAYAAGFIP